MRLVGGAGLQLESTNNLDVGGPYSISRLKRRTCDRPIDMAADSIIELSVVGRDLDRAQCADTISVTPYRPPDMVITGNRRRGVSRPTPMREESRSYDGFARRPSPFAEQISTPRDIEESMSLSITASVNDLAAFWAERADRLRVLNEDFPRLCRVGKHSELLLAARKRALPAVR